MLSTLVIIALQYSRRVFWFSFGHWLSTTWFFSRSRTRLVFSFVFTQKTFSFSSGQLIRDIFISCSWPGVFCFFLVPWILVDNWLVNIYIYIYIYIYIPRIWHYITCNGWYAMKSSRIKSFIFSIYVQTGFGIKLSTSVDMPQNTTNEPIDQPSFLRMKG